jgi:hypothetical protein
VPALSPIANHRDPYVVYESTRRALATALRELALQPYGHVPIDDIVLDAYPRMMERLLHDAGSLTERQIVHVRFEDLRPTRSGRSSASIVPSSYRTFLRRGGRSRLTLRPSVITGRLTMRCPGRASCACRSSGTGTWQNAAVERLDRTARHSLFRERWRPAPS